MAYPPDPRPPKRVRDPELLRELHGRWRECALCGETDRLSLHHIHKHPRNDVEANLIMLCGDGVQGCHGDIEANHHGTKLHLASHILANRQDTIYYLRDLLGDAAAIDWFERQMS